MLATEILVIGGGPAGLSAAIKAAEAGAKVILLERDFTLGGQLVKQTHCFFGSSNEYAGTRGINIAAELREKARDNPRINIMLESTAQGYYEDGVLVLTHRDRYKEISAEKIIVATGASEKMLPFINNDLPGVYGAGAVQTLMNVYGVLPGRRVLMVGSGNIGLIVSYQLLQAGIKVAAIIEALPRIGGYLVHAAKVRRSGIPILTGYTIKKAVGSKRVEKVVICRLDQDWNQVADSDLSLEVDTICLAVGLRPLTDILIQAGCQMAFVPELGGDVPVRDENLKTTESKFYVAGDTAGVEEATAAILEGELAAVSSAIELGYSRRRLEGERKNIKEKLANLRRGPVGEKIRNGLARIEGVKDAGRGRYSYIK